MWSATSNNKRWRLVWIEPPVPWAWVPPWDTIPYLYLWNSILFLPWSICSS
jgi:hypothetical protein